MEKIRCEWCATLRDADRVKPFLDSKRVCSWCEEAFRGHMGWGGFQPHGRPPGVLDKLSKWYGKT